MGWFVFFLATITLYTNDSKNREFDKEALQIFCSDRVTIAKRQGTSENKKYEARPMQSKTDSANCLCVYDEELSLKSLLSSLDPLSVSEHLAFYELYPETQEGKKALSYAWQLLNQSKVELNHVEFTPPPLEIQTLISLVTRQPFDEKVVLTEEQLKLVGEIGKGLHHKKLKGHDIWTRAELIALDSKEVDLSRGLLINQFDEKKEEIQQYEAALDLMALQILARLPLRATPQDKIREINRFIFEEMKFRFPPHSIYAKEIDLYTFLPSVLDSREGVCLGVSILYLSLAQRVGLTLEIITPPGHIYVRYREGVSVINIETTARGINLPSDTYLGVDTRWLQERTLKEVIGLAYVNQASVAWGQGDYEQTVELYEKALPYLSKDPLIHMLLGFNYLFIGKKNEAKTLLKPLKELTFDYAVSQETIPEDYLNGRIDSEGIKIVFMHVDEKKESVVNKQKQLEKVVARYPRFRAGLLQLAVTWLQLGRSHEACEILEKYHTIDPSNCIVEYYLSILCFQRLDYNKAWSYLKQAENLLSKREHHCKALSSVRNGLRRLCPEIL